MINFYRYLPVPQRRFVFFVVLVAIILTSLPYLVGAIRSIGTDYTYLGLNPLGPADTDVYFSFIEQVKQGKVFIENLHTSEPQAGSIFHPLWLVLGWVAAVGDLSIPFVFHLARILLGIVFLLFVYYFLASVFDRERPRAIAFALIAFSSGIGSLFTLGVDLSNGTQIILLYPADHWISESNTFLTLLHSPLFILSQFLLLLIFWYVLHEDRYRSFTIVGALVFLLTLVHPYDLVTVAAILPLFLVARVWREEGFTPPAFYRYVRRILLLALFSLPAILYFFATTAIEPAIGGWTEQNITTSPPVHSYLIGYGLLWIFAIVGFTVWRRTAHRERLFVLTWTVVSLCLIYVPVQINRRLTNGLHIVFAILAAVGVDLLWQWISKRLAHRELLRQSAIAALVWVCGLTLFFSPLVVIARAVYWSSPKEDSIYYLPSARLAAMSWLRGATSDDDIILSHSFNGNILPAQTGRRVYVGHGHQTLQWDEKRTRVNRWFFGTDDDDAAKEAFLKQARITYIFFSPIEDRLGDFVPSAKSYLAPVYTNGDTTIYTVR